MKPIFTLVIAIFLVAGAASAQTASSLFSGNISMTYAESLITSQDIIYKTVHLVTKSGSILDADQLKATLGAGNSLSQAVATGHVRAYVDDPVSGRKYTVTSDTAIFDPKANTIDLTGNVTAVIVSSYTEGPLIQTGTSAHIQLGKGPDFPQILMHQGHTEFTAKQ